MAKLPNEPSSEITPQPVYVRRREFIKNAALLAGTATAVGGGLLWVMSGGRADPPEPASPPPGAAPSASQEVNAEPVAPAAARSPYSTDEAMTPYKDVTGYNNFYEFGVDKTDPARNASTLRPRPWTVSIEGEVNKPQTLDIDTLLGWFPLEERIYR